MARIAWTALVFASACGSIDDNRPLDATYLTEAVIAPACGTAECHSTFTQKKGLVFDTLVGMRAAMLSDGLISLDSTQFDPAAPEGSSLITWLTTTDPFAKGTGRMPLDAPLPNEDIHFIERWIQGVPQRLDDGTVTYPAPAKGAQCDPKQNQALACINKDLYQCGADWNVTTKLQTCAGDCSAGACR